MAEITWSIPALEDVTEIGLFFERDSPEFAEVIVRRLYYSVDRLREFSRSGRTVPELQDDVTREVIVEGYRVVYELIHEQVNVLAVLSGRQDIRKKLGKIEKR